MRREAQLGAPSSDRSRLIVSTVIVIDNMATNNVNGTMNDHKPAKKVDKGAGTTMHITNYFDNVSRLVRLEQHEWHTDDSAWRYSPHWSWR